MVSTIFMNTILFRDTFHVPFKVKLMNIMCQLVVMTVSSHERATQYVITLTVEIAFSTVDSSQSHSMKIGRQPMNRKSHLCSHRQKFLFMVI